MRFTETRLAGCFVVEPEPRADERGFFARIFCTRELADHGIAFEVAQTNWSRSGKRGTLRGLHWQAPPHAEAKLVKCTAGSLYDVAVDLRPGSPTYRTWVGVELTAAGGTMLYVPEGCAHGYLTLEDGSEATYFVTAPYAPDAERGLRWDDPSIGIEWPIRQGLSISEKDRRWPDLPA